VHFYWPLLSKAHFETRNQASAQFARECFKSFLVNLRHQNKPPLNLIEEEKKVSKKYLKNIENKCKLTSIWAVIICEVILIKIYITHVGKLKRNQTTINEYLVAKKFYLCFLYFNRFYLYIYLYKIRFIYIIYLYIYLYNIYLSVKDKIYLYKIFLSNFLLANVYRLCKLRGKLFVVFYNGNYLIWFISWASERVIDYTQFS